MNYVGRWALPILGILCLVLPQGSAAQRRHLTTVAIGSTGAAQGGAPTAEALKSTLADELAQLKGVGVAPAGTASFILHGSVIRLEREDAQRFHCEVSLIVADRRGGSVRMMLEGRAVAEGPSSAAQLQERALRHAVRGALRPLPEQLGAKKRRRVSRWNADRR